ncbi:MAG: aminopeptidase P family protein [Chloroflexi bacterium]|nr:aminopeptidase P family protein [Chloroflexota bacterium]
MTAALPAQRLDRVRAALDEAGLDGLYVASPVDDVNHRHSANRRYLTGFSGSTGYAAISATEAFLAVDSRYGAQARREAEPRGFSIFDTKGPQAAWLPEFVAAAGLAGKRVGLSRSDLSYGDFLTLREAVERMPEADRPDLVPAPPIVERLRARKDAEELALLEEAIAIAERAFLDVTATLEPGVTERGFAASLDAAVKKHGARGLSFEPIVAGGERGAMPHADLSDRPFGAGEPIIVDWGAELSGYCSDLTRTFYLGPEPERFRGVYEVVREAQQAAIERVEAGMTGADAHTLAASVIEEHGYGDAFTHGLGHGVGLDVHDYPPYLGPTSEDVLEDGMVFTIEPGIYLPGWGGVRIEDIVTLEDGRARQLSHLDSTLPAGAQP